MLLRTFGLIFAVGMCVIATACGGGGDDGGSGDGGNRTCASFQYQQDAQSYFASNRSSARGLDGDSDGIACESLPSRPNAVPALPTVVPSASDMPAGIWVGSLGNGEGLRGVIFPNGDTWFLRTRSTSQGAIGTWMMNGPGTIAGSTFRLTSGPTIRIEPGTSAILEQTALSLTVQKSSSLNGTWTQASNTYSMQAAYQASQLPVPSLSSLAGSYGDGVLASTITISANGALVGRVSATCRVSGQLTLVSGDPAYRIELQSSGACPSGYVAGSGVLTADRTNNQVYLTASSLQGRSATLVLGTKQ